MSDSAYLRPGDRIRHTDGVWVYVRARRKAKHGRLHDLRRPDGWQVTLTVAELRAEFGGR